MTVNAADTGTQFNLCNSFRVGAGLIYVSLSQNADMNASPGPQWGVDVVRRYGANLQSCTQRSQS
jgi:hypothetical protein